MKNKELIMEELYELLLLSEIEAETTDERFTHKEVFDDIRKNLGL